MKQKIINWLKENKLKIFIIVIVLIVISGGFYWYEWRPYQTKKECYRLAIEIAKKDGYHALELYNFYYKTCLNSRGL